MRARVGITTGDPAGIGPEIIQAALASGKLPNAVEYQVIGATSGFSLGSPTRASAEAARDALETAAARASAGELDAIVTGPIHKARMYEIGFRFPGQTEFFAERSGVKNFAMLLTGGGLTVALVSIHLPLREAVASLRASEIVRVGELLARFVVRRGGQRVAVAGLNPHAGEDGAFGREEIDIIAPAIAQLNQSAIGNRRSAAFSGPFSPDTIFHRAVAGEFDAVLCMYHDQGLIPLKLHAFDSGVNVTLGLPFPRTSPDHGTAFEIAGKGIARPESMIAAIQLAVALAAPNDA